MALLLGPVPLLAFMVCEYSRYLAAASFLCFMSCVLDVSLTQAVAFCDLLLLQILQAVFVTTSLLDVDR